MTANDSDRENLGTLRLELVPLLEDQQAFYHVRVRSHLEDAAARLVATLALLSKSFGIAETLLRQCEDLDALASWLASTPEMLSVSRALTRAYAQRLDEKIPEQLAQLYAIASPLPSGFKLGQNPVVDVLVPAGSCVAIPALRQTVRAHQPTNLGSILEQVLAADGAHTLDATITADLRAGNGIRISPVARDTEAVWSEFTSVSIGDLPCANGLSRVIGALDDISAISVELDLAMADLMTLYSIFPSANPERRAGSISGLFGWAWQDVDTCSDEELEHCYLSSQMIHEYFHTKLSIVERSAKIYRSDGRTPFLFSPWKLRERPLRQVVHALVTFSAGAVVWSRLLRMPGMAAAARSAGVAYVTQTLQYARSTRSLLTESEALTAAGQQIADTCLDGLVADLREIGIH